VFLVSGLVIFFLTADIFHPSLDEGIYLEGGHRVLLGQAPYRDFFAYTGPLIYWVQALLEGIFGPNLRMLRLSTSISVGLTCFATFWIMNRLAGWRPGVAVAALYLAIRMPSIQHFTVSHRWLSTALMTAAIAAALDAARETTRSRWTWSAVGALMAAAAWATPTDLVPLALLGVWLLWSRNTRGAFAFVMAGVAAVSLPAALWLVAHGALWPMFDKLVWASRQYSVANAVPYGYYPFAFRNVETETGFSHSVTAWVLALRPLLPALLIPLALALGLFEIFKRRWQGARALLVLLAFGMFLTTWPRWDVNLLIGVTPPFYVIAALWCEQYLRDSRKRVAYLAGLVINAVSFTLAFSLAIWLFSIVNNYSYFETRVGLLRNAESDGAAMDALGYRIPAGADVFIFPYMPVIGFILQTNNPTSYSYLQPGMMSREDEATVLGQLRSRPPQFVLRQFLPEDQIFQVWPGSDRNAMRFPSIERFIDERFVEVEQVSSEHFRMTVLKRK